MSAITKLCTNAYRNNISCQKFPVDINEKKSNRHPWPIEIMCKKKSDFQQKRLTQEQLRKTSLETPGVNGKIRLTLKWIFKINRLRRS
jgi:hypothetical protein